MESLDTDYSGTYYLVSGWDGPDRSPREGAEEIKMSNMHNLFKGRVSAARCKKIDRLLAAAGVDAEITAAVIPGDGPRGWFTSPNLGFPFDRDTAAATLRVLEGAGLWPPAK